MSVWPASTDVRIWPHFGHLARVGMFILIRNLFARRLWASNYASSDCALGPSLYFFNLIGRNCLWPGNNIAEPAVGFCFNILQIWFWLFVKRPIERSSIL